MVGNALMSDNFDNVRHALAPFKQSFIAILKVLGEASSIEQQSKQELETSYTSLQTDLAPTAKSPEENDQIKSQFDDLKKQFPEFSNLI